MEWIDVNDRLPTDKKLVLILEKYEDEPTLGFFDGKEWKADIKNVGVDCGQHCYGGSACSILISNYVTHWTPLPKAPEQ